MKERRTKIRVNQEAYALAIKTWLEREASAYDIVEVTGLHINTAYELVKTFKRHGLIHICGYLPNGLGVDTTPIFKWGPGRDARRRRKTNKQRSADYRERRKMIRRDPMIAALHTTEETYRGFKITKGVTCMVEGDPAYFKEQGYKTMRAAHGAITRYIQSRGESQEEGEQK